MFNFSEMINLKHIDVCYLRELENQHIVSILKYCKNLRHLDIAYTKVTQLPVEDLSNLEYLSIAGTEINVDAEFCDKLGSIPSLKSVHLSTTNFCFENLMKLVKDKDTFMIKAFNVKIGFTNIKAFGYLIDKISKSCRIKLEIALPKVKDVLKEMPHLKPMFILPKGF